MYEANLSFHQLSHYLRLLTSTRLLEKTIDDGKETYKVTQKGKDFAAKYEQLMELLTQTQTATLYRPQKQSSQKNLSRDKKGKMAVKPL